MNFFRTHQQSLFLLLFYALLAAALLAPLAANQVMPAIVDYTNHIAYVIEAKLALLEGQFPLRIAPLELSGWRYPNYQFYSPTVYTIAGFIYRWLTPANPMTAVKLTIWGGLVLGGFYMQRLAYAFVKSRPASILASVVYLTAPYYIVVITGFGNLCETVGLGLLPAVLYYSLQRYLHPKNTITLLQAGLLWYLLITSHLVTFVYTALFSFILLFIITSKNRSQWRNLWAAGIGLVFGCLLAMWFLAPVGLLQNYLIIAKTIHDSRLFMSSHPSILDLLYPGHLQFQGPLGSNHVAVGWPILLAAAMGFYAFFTRSHITQKGKEWLWPLLLLFFITFILLWSPIHFELLPSLFFVGQYSWRLLNQLIWMGALLFAWALCWLFKNKLDRRHTIVGILLLMITASSSFPILYTNYFNINLADFIKHPYAIFNPDSYTIDFNKHTQFVDKIDTLTLYSLIANKNLVFNKTYSLPQALLQYAKKPTVTLSGTLPNSLQRPLKIQAVLNESVIAVRNLSSGKFRWDIPLTPAVLSPFKHDKTLQLQFKMKGNNPMPIPLDDILLTGFLQAPATWNVKTVQPFCRQKKTITVCEINVPQKTQLLELPILFYPRLLHITLNGKTVPYTGIVYQNNLIAGITPEAGKTNIITIQFVGLTWANIVSCLSWGFWLILLVSIFFRNYSRRQ